MKIASKLGWMLALGAVLLLAVAGKLDLLLILIPAAAVLAYAITRLPHHTTGAAGGLK